jgi:hypothetical protein
VREGAGKFKKHLPSKRTNYKATAWFAKMVKVVDGHLVARGRHQEQPSQGKPQGLADIDGLPHPDACVAGSIGLRFAAARPSETLPRRNLMQAWHVHHGSKSVAQRPNGLCLQCHAPV